MSQKDTKEKDIGIHSFPSKREKYLSDQRTKLDKELKTEQREHLATIHTLGGVLTDLEIVSGKYDKLLEKIDKGACLIYLDEDNFITDMVNIPQYSSSIITIQDQEIIEKVKHPLYNKVRYLKLEKNKVVVEETQLIKFRGVIS